jgi:transposase
MLRRRKSHRVSFARGSPAYAGIDPSKALQKSLKSHITWLDKPMATLNDDLSKRLRTSEAWKAQDDLLRGIPGVGAVTRLTLTAQCPELGQLNRQQMASQAGRRRALGRKTRQWQAPGQAMASTFLGAHQAPGSLSRS